MLSYLYPNYVIGHSQPLSTTDSQTYRSATPPNLDTTDPTNPDLNNANNSSDSLKQEEILRKFYSGDINLLICTYEMEAHITAPSCVNLIIRFDCTISTDPAASPPSFDYSAYIATKSRAQSKNAACFFFIHHTHFDSFFQRFIACKQIEEKFITCYSRLLSDHRDNQPINTTKTTDDKAVLSLDTAIRFINRYCIRLPSDALTQLTPRQLTIARRQDNGSIESEWRPSASLAQRSAAFRGCLLLSRQKELNDMLEPVTKEMFYRISHKSDADDEREWTQFSSYFQRHQQQAGAQSLSSLQQQISSYMAHRPGGVKRRQVVRKLFSGLYLKSFQNE